MKGLKSNLSTHGSMGKIMVLSSCGEFVYIKKSINSIIRIDLKTKIANKAEISKRGKFGSKDSANMRKRRNYRLELNTEDFYIVDFCPLPKSQKLLILGNKCELRIYDFASNDDYGAQNVTLVNSKEILRPELKTGKIKSKDQLRFRTEYRDTISMKTDSLLGMSLEKSNKF